MDETSLPGSGSDPLEADFEKGLQDQGFELEGRQKPEQKPEAPADKKVEDPADKKPDDDKKPDEGDKSKDEGKKADQKPEKGNEEWRQMIAKRRQENSKSDGKADLKPDEPVKPAPLHVDEKKPDTPVLTDKQKTFAEKYGIEPDDLVDLFPPTKQETIVKEGMSEEDRKSLEEYRTQRDNLLIEKGYNSDFDSNVLPLLKEEYPTISDAKVKEIKEQIFEKLKTDEFARTPLEVIYRGDSTFRGLVTPPKNGIDTGTRVPANGNSGKVYDFASVTEADIRNADFPFQQYSEYMEKSEKGKK